MRVRELAATRSACSPAAELVEVVHLGQIRGEYHQHCFGDRLGDLVELERRKDMRIFSSSAGAWWSTARDYNNRLRPRDLNRWCGAWL